MASDTQDLYAPPFVLALDVGTSSARAALFDSRAREVEGAGARVERGFVKSPEGGHEFDADELVETVARAVDAALARAPAEISARVETIATACFWHSLVGTSDDGDAVTPVYGWADTRVFAEAERLAQTQDERAAHLRTGCPFHPSYWPAKLLWLREERPQLFRAAARWLSFGEYLIARLCGTEPASRASVSMASGTGLFDVRACAWDAPLLSSLDIDERSLPALADDQETFRLADEWAARWPQLRGARVFPAVGDGAANNIGEGCTSRAQAALMVGTSAAMRVAYEGAPPREFDRALWCYRVDRRRVVLGGALSDGGGLREWMTRTLALDLDVDALARTKPDGHGLTILPFWSGERSTGWHARARGAIVGLGAHTRPEEIMRAALEAVAYRMARVAGALDAHAPGARVRASGGALRASELWARLFSDVLARPLSLSRVSEASSRGAVLLALEATGAIQSVSDAAPHDGLSIQPDAARTDVYRRALERQQRLYELLVGAHADAEPHDAVELINKGHTN
ncbi:MAG TPA: gluconokinase [Pyrinomonadaceae bacterium]|nr:gluconokinase [Pyrinomonadaceae bacterium]